MATANQALTPDAAGSGARQDSDDLPIRTDADGIVTCTLGDRLDALRALPLRAQFDDVVAGAAAGASGLIVDLSDVTFVDSAGLAALVRLRRQCGTVGLDLKFIKPRNAEALRIFRLTQFDEVFVMLDGPRTP